MTSAPIQMNSTGSGLTARARRSDVAIAAAKAERHQTPDGEPPTVTGPLIPLRAQAAGHAVALTIIALAIWVRIAATDDAPTPSIEIQVAAIALMLAITALSYWDARRRLPVEPLPEAVPRRGRQRTFLGSAGWQTTALAYGVLVAVGLPTEPFIIWLFAAITGSGVIASAIQLSAIAKRERQAGGRLYGLQVRGQQGRRCFARIEADD